MSSLQPAEARQEAISTSPFQVLAYAEEPPTSPHPVHASLQVSPGVEVELYDGSQDPASFDMVLFYDHHESLLGRAAAARVGVLLLEVTEGQKVELGELVGTATRGASHAYFFHRSSDVYTTIIELPRSASGGEPAEPSPLAYAWQVLRHVTARREGKLTVVPPWQAEANKDAEGPQPKQKHFTLYKVVTGKVPANYPGAIDQSAEQPNVTLTAKINVSIYENQDPTRGDFYLVFMNNASTAYPGRLVDYTEFTKGFEQFEYIASLRPAHNESHWEYDNHSPTNVSHSKTVTTGWDFSVSVDSKGKKGSVGYKSSVTESIAEWKIVDETRGSETRWHYLQNDPDPHFPFCFGWNVESFPVLSTATLTVNTASLWRTTSLKAPATWFDVTMWHQLRFFHVNVFTRYLSRGFVNAYDGGHLIDFRGLQYPPA